MLSINNKRYLESILLLALILIPAACKKTVVPVNEPTVDVVLIGGGVMSGTLGSILTELDPNLSIRVYERLHDLALESSAAWNNAGTGHASYSELNYTPEVEGSIDIKKAIEVNAAFEISKEYWVHLVRSKKFPHPSSFINDVPHMSFVWGDNGCEYLKKRYEALIKHPFFKGMEYTEDKEKIKKWVPLVMEGRDLKERVAATRMVGGTDVDFGTLTKSLFAHMQAHNKNSQIHLLHEVTDLIRNEDNTWRVVVKDLRDKKQTALNAKFVFIGAGGNAILLLEKSGIKEAEGFGGFPVGGAWLVSDNEKLIDQHWAKVYGQAGVGAPPMSVPHLDTRFIDGKRALLFGPFATFTTKFLKTGSYSDLFRSVNTSNLVPMLQVAFHNFNLVSYLVGQVLMSEEGRLKSLREYMPTANIEDWRLSKAGQRVQVIKKDPDKGGVLQFGTELVGCKDGSIVALLGASPGAST
ncbi:MAG TPA: malate dehydrogenase (quinone), partial [Myxococcota bacterium]|nr:malate dehydrogenase (quinone) [Myxococcota bacterium]